MRLRTQWKWFSPVRVAMAFECFFITSPKGLLQMRPFQMRITASSESPSASDTIRQAGDTTTPRQYSNPEQDRDCELNLDVTQEDDPIDGAIGRDRFAGGRESRIDETPN